MAEASQETLEDFPIKKPSNKQSFKKSKNPNEYEQQKQFFANQRPPTSGRYGRTAFRPPGELDPYSPDLAPMNNFENQVIPIGIHNISKSFRPNLTTVRVLSWDEVHS